MLVFYNLKDVIPFGKYRYKKTINWIINNDPQYLSWALDNIDWFQVDDKVFNKLVNKLASVK